MKTITYIFLTACMLSFCVACDSFLTIDDPKTELIQDGVFGTDKSAEAAIAGLYSFLSSAANLGYISIHTSLNADELIYNSNDASVQQFFESEIDRENSRVQSTWSAFYKAIYEANAIVEGLDKNGAVAQEIREQLSGEAKAIRAFCYFYLTQLWGDVPLVTGTDYLTSQLAPRSSQTLVYEQIISDLSNAIDDLPTAYPTADRARINQYASRALLARVYLSNSAWSDVEAQCDRIINDPLYKLEEPDNVFLKESTESIWQLQPASTTITYGLSGFLPLSTTVIPSYTLTENLVKDFNENDKRYTAWITSNKVDNLLYYYPSKYKAKGVITSEYLVMFRLAEQYLIRAEARARQQNLVGAMEDLNVIRRRAGLGDLASDDQDEVLDFITAERKLELFTEWGDRWFTLKRLNQSAAVLRPIKQNNWSNTDIWWPIPYNELQSNPDLTQNSGYEK